MGGWDLKPKRVEWISIAMAILFLLALTGYEIHIRRNKSTFSLRSDGEAATVQAETAAESAAESETVPAQTEIETETEEVSAATASDLEAEPDTRIDLNTADAAQLKTLPGIGDVLAERIIAYREEHGEFSTVEEIMNVKGIASGKFADLQDKICVRTEQAH